MNEKSKKNVFLGREFTLVVAVIAVLVISMFFFRVFTNSLVDKVTNTISLSYSKELNEQMSSHISTTLDYYYHELNSEYNALRRVGALDEDKLKEFISDVEYEGSISYVAFADSEGYVYEADGSYLGTMRIPMLGSLLNGEERIVSDNVTIGSNNYIIIGSSYTEPIRMGNKTINIALMGLDNNELSEHILMQSDYSGSYSSIIHKDGSFVIKNADEPYSGLNIFSMLSKNYSFPDNELLSLKSAVRSGETYFTLVGDDVSADNAFYLFFAPISNTDWYIENALPSSVIKSNIVVMRNSVEIAYVIFTAVFLLAALIEIVQLMLSKRKLKENQVELENAFRVAEEASGAKTSFLFSMSHDIRTPMNAILGYTDIGLKHVENSAQAKDSFQKIKMAGGHLLNLINDILEMSRIESGKMELNEKPLDIRKAISDVTIMSQSLAQPKNIDFKTVIGDIQNPYIYADELHINEVIINIISNAVKYTPSGGEVRYNISQSGICDDGKTTFRFEISDNGIGMSEKFQEHLFETFSREENTTISKTEGTGLGLSIVKKIVDMAGGTINVHSVQHQGSTFTVEIPFRVMDEKSIADYENEIKESEDISQNFSFDGKKVLLAEDNELNREIATCILEDVGLEVDTAEDGTVAVSAVIDKGTDYYDFILMDIQMPLMNGYEASRKIRELPGGNRIPIIALSANAFEEDKKKSLEEGMDAHVAKPIDVKVLFETMQKLIRHKNQD